MEKGKHGKDDFKVIIIGGAVAGLTLAHCLDRANIDYVLLERRSEIAPAWGSGAAQAIAANGARILDQLHLLEAIDAVSTDWKETKVFKEDGTLLTATDSVLLIEQRLGYKPHLLERRLLLQTLYDTLRDKSRTHLDKDVKKIEHLPNGVVVTCSDGSTYIGDVVVGADGIRSKVRGWMRERVSKAGSSHLLKSDVHSITSEFGGIYGVSTLPEEFQKDIRPGDFCRTVAKGRSALLIPLKDGRTAWVVSLQFNHRLPQELLQQSTTADLQRYVATHGDFHLHSKLTVKDLYKYSTIAKFVPFEESCSDVWTWDRIVCMGDAIHKMTPNMGQGSNQAIESAAVLASCLNRMLQYSNRKPTISEVRAALGLYQSQRKSRAHMITKRANIISNIDAQSSTILRILSFQAMFVDDFLAGASVSALIGAPRIEYLPNPPRAITGTLGFKMSDKSHTTEPRWLRALRALPLLAVLVVSLRTFGVVVDNMLSLLRSHAQSHNFIAGIDHVIPMNTSYLGIPGIDRVLRILVGAMIPVFDNVDPLGQLQAIALFADALPVLVIWWIESIRRGNSFTVASTLAPCFLGMVYQLKGLCIVAPIYFFCHYFQSPVVNFMAQDLRMVNVARIKTLLPAVIIGYLIPCIVMFLPSVSSQTRQFANAIWQLHPIWVSVLSFLFSRAIKDTTSTDRIRNPKADIQYLRAAYIFAFVAASSVYLSLWLASPYSMKDIFFTGLRDPAAGFTYITEASAKLLRYDLICSFSAGLYWTLLHVGDLKRQGLVQTNWLVILPVMASMTVAFGPGACMVACWAWREEVLTGWKLASVSKSA